MNEQLILKNNLILIIQLKKQLIEKSKEKNPYFLHSIIPLDFFVKNNIFLELENDPKL